MRPRRNEQYISWGAARAFVARMSDSESEEVDEVMVDLPTSEYIHVYEDSKNNTAQIRDLDVQIRDVGVRSNARSKLDLDTVFGKGYTESFKRHQEELKSRTSVENQKDYINEVMMPDLYSLSQRHQRQTQYAEIVKKCNALIKSTFAETEKYADPLATYFAKLYMLQHELCSTKEELNNLIRGRTEWAGETIKPIPELIQLLESGKNLELAQLEMVYAHALCTVGPAAAYKMVEKAAQDAEMPEFKMFIRGLSAAVPEHEDLPTIKNDSGAPGGYFDMRSTAAPAFGRSLRF